MILIGSRALKLRCSQALLREPLDFDWICTQEEHDQWVKEHSHKVNPIKMYSIEANGTTKHIVEGSPCLEFEIIKTGHSTELLKELVEKDPETMDAVMFGKIPSLDLLFTIKDSHKFKKFHIDDRIFWKTATDWHAMNRIGAKVREEHREFLSLREKETYTNSLPKLNMSKVNFFDETQNGVHMTYQHDDIHCVICLYDRPAYTYYLKEGSEVLTDNKKFWECSEEIRLAGVMEEAMVLAIERSLVSCPNVLMPDRAFRLALAKVASSITSGAFRSYAHLHLFEALKIYPRDYWEKFQKAVENGIVRRYIMNDAKKIEYRQDSV